MTPPPARPPRIVHGDCLDIMKMLPDNSVDSIVTDPPYGLGFMGKAWDALPPGLEWAEECLRVLKPGGHLLAFGGTRTWHRLAVAVEDAGFEIRDSIAWMYGSGFPKSHDVSKGIDKNNGETGRLHKFTEWMRTTGITSRRLDDITGTRMGGHYLTAASQPAIPTPELWAMIRPHCSAVPEWVDELVLRIAAEREVLATETRYNEPSGIVGVGQGERVLFDRKITAPATEAAAQWQGWGTALKPAFEPVVVARKPFKGTVAANVQQWGTGALNIDATRIGYQSDADYGRNAGFARNPAESMFQNGTNGQQSSTAGRWPANVVLDEHAAEVLDAQSGVSRSVVGRKQTSTRAATNGATHGGTQGGYNYATRDAEVGYSDNGGASRFFYVAKAPKKERPVVDGVAHATVKPLALMRWLVRLVTPPGGTVLEPFAGSGTTVEACILEGFHCIAIEREAEYLPLIQARIDRQAA